MNQEVLNINTVEGVSIPSNSSNSIIESALLDGFVFEYSCKNGQCGVCKTTLLEGEVIELQPQLALSEEDRLANKILTCCCATVSDILIDAEELSALKDIETKTFPARINSLRNLTDEVVEVMLRLPPTTNFDFLEGQYLDVMQNNIRRSYSIASTNKDKEIKLLIKEYPNGQMSNYWFNQAKENDLLRIEGPKGTFFLRESKKPLLFLATGTGIAPIISMLQGLDEDDTYHQAQPINVYWGNRKAEEFFWQPIFTKLNVSFYQVNSQPNDDWSECEGYVQEIALNKIKNITDFDVYACGSNAMIQSAKQQFIGKGLPENQFYSDAFVQSY
ncbi:FAD-binding oxidoreductase [Thiomicrorhabdus sp. Kp2]|uniref:FAD-binding oxidoreductase n=1 Tax=Thiomicrorhabdus sp. Kp2 TaxID=1123518 RepID=UPI0006863616|nr:FAD-binding oxidoreductase [Thiomicrorhabdus sp. Kp2]